MKFLWPLTLLAATAAAQPTWEHVTGLSAGTEIRVTLDGRTLRGFLQGATPDTLAINATTSQETLARQDIRRVQWKRPGHRGRNTLIGLAAGASGGLIAGAALDATSNDDWFRNVGKVILTPFGAIVGTVVGVAFPTGRWREVYRAP